MKSVLLIGLGKFGQTLGEALLKMGDDVMIVDKNEDVINSLASRYTKALITNCMNINNLKELDVPFFDVCIVAIGEDFQSSLEITSLLRDCGAKYIIARAATEIQKKFLLRNGADEVIYPDLDIAEKLALRINLTNVYVAIDFDSTHSIFELAVPASWVGKTLIDINPRQKYNLNVLIVKDDASTVLTSSLATHAFEADDRIVVFGETENIIKFSGQK